MRRRTPPIWPRARSEKRRRCVSCVILRNGGSRRSISATSCKTESRVRRTSFGPRLRPAATSITMYRPGFCISSVSHGEGSMRCACALRPAPRSCGKPSPHPTARELRSASSSPARDRSTKRRAFPRKPTPCSDGSPTADCRFATSRTYESAICCGSCSRSAWSGWDDAWALRVRRPLRRLRRKERLIVQLRRGAVGGNRDGFLNRDRPRVDTFVDPKPGDAALPVSHFEGPVDRIAAPMPGKEARVKTQDAESGLGDLRRLEDPRDVRQDDQIAGRSFDERVSAALADRARFVVNLAAPDDLYAHDVDLREGGGPAISGRARPSSRTPTSIATYPSAFIGVRRSRWKCRERYGEGRYAGEIAGRRFLCNGRAGAVRRRRTSRSGTAASGDYGSGQLGPRGEHGGRSGHRPADGLDDGDDRGERRLGALQLPRLTSGAGTLRPLDSRRRIRSERAGGGRRRFGNGHGGPEARPDARSPFAVEQQRMDDERPRDACAKGATAQLRHLPYAAAHRELALHRRAVRSRDPSDGKLCE